MPDSDEKHGDCNNCTHLYIVIFVLSFFLVLVIILFASTISADPIFIQQLSNEKYRDSVQVALSLGRLDVIVILLMLLTIGVGALAIYGYNEIKNQAIRVAKRTSKEVAKYSIKEEARLIASKEAKAVYRNLIRTAMPTADIDELVKSIGKETEEISIADISSNNFKVPQDIELLYMDKDDGDE